MPEIQVPAGAIPIPQPKRISDDPVLRAISTINSLTYLSFGASSSLDARLKTLSQMHHKRHVQHTETKTRSNNNPWFSAPGELGTPTVIAKETGEYMPHKKDNAQKKNPDGKKRNK